MSKRFEDFDEEAKQYKDIILNYRDNGKVFVDDNFHPTATIPEKDISFDDSTIEWHRIDEIYDVPLFKKELIHYNFVQKGKLEDSYFLSAILQLSQQPHLIPFLFDKQADLYLGNIKDSINLKCGAVVIYFNAFGCITPVLIDTLIPFSKGTRIPIFSRPSDTTKSPWFCLVEKAYAKLNGSYTELIGDSFSQAIYSLYGYFTTSKDISNLKSAEKIAKMTPFDRILKYQKQNSIISATIQVDSQNAINELTSKGLTVIQPYLLIETKQHEGKNFICLRSPQIEHKWNGDYSYNSPLWTSKTRPIFYKYDDTTFWMSDSDFFNYFTKIHVSKQITQNMHVRYFFYRMEPGGYDNPTIETEEAFSLNLPRFAIQVTENFTDFCRFHILCERKVKSVDDKGQISEKAPPFCIEMKSRHLYLVKFHKESGSSNVISFPYFVKNNSEILVVQMRRLEECSMVEDCYVKVLCNKNFSLIDINKPEIEIPEYKEPNSVFEKFSAEMNMIQLSEIEDNKVVTSPEIKKAAPPISQSSPNKVPQNSPNRKNHVNEEGQFNSPQKSNKNEGQINSPLSTPTKRPISNQQHEKASKPSQIDSNKPNQISKRPISSQNANRTIQNPPKTDPSRTPQSARKVTHPHKRSQEKPNRVSQIQSPSQKPKVSLAQVDSPSNRPRPKNNFSNQGPPHHERSKRQFDQDWEPVYPQNQPKVVKAKPPKSIDLSDQNIRKMYNSISGNVFSSYLS